MCGRSLRNLRTVGVFIAERLGLLAKFVTQRSEEMELRICLHVTECHSICRLSPSGCKLATERRARKSSSPWMATPLAGQALLLASVKFELEENPSLKHSNPFRFFPKLLLAMPRLDDTLAPNRRGEANHQRPVT